ncbi:MAG: hypothetical protein E7627_02350 [Ruminococcaceae bacterium]|nr:hypothetical protein [Oscillospiraceae bacterium]
MIEFFSDIPYNKIVISKKYPDMLQREVSFSIKINGELFFQEPNFSIDEFIFFVDDWMDKKTEEMLYNAVDTDDNPLISFIKNENKWEIHSAWELFECKEKFDRKMIETAIIQYKQRQ